MYPELFQIGPFTVYSYGLMLGIAFITASYLLTKEFERLGLSNNVANEITILALIFGIIGSKLLHLIENWNEFINEPWDMAFSPGGLTFYGGLILAALAVYLYVKKKGLPFIYFFDVVAPMLALSYGIGRIGCHLAGDGDYGIPTDLPWGTNYENGVVPPSAMFSESDIAASFPDGIVPNNTPLHPTPVYEFLFAVALFFLLWSLRKKILPQGKLFSIYLFFTGLGRFLVEFIRLNPKLLFGLSEAQLISILFMLWGAIWFFYLTKNSVVKEIIIPASLKAEAKKEQKQ